MTPPSVAGLRVKMWNCNNFLLLLLLLVLLLLLRTWTVKGSGVSERPALGPKERQIKAAAYFAQAQLNVLVLSRN